MTGKTKRPRSSSKQAWKGRSDTGPHTAVFPSGATLTFRIPDQAALLRSGKLPDRLRRTAILCAGHPAGPEGYMADLVMQAMISAERAELVEQAIEDGIRLQNILIAEMLVEPQVTADEVEAGDFPEPDLRMLLEFAERKRDRDAAGNRLPVIMLADWATFRGELQGAGSAGNGGDGGDEHGAAVPDADGDPV